MKKLLPLLFAFVLLVLVWEPGYAQHHTLNRDIKFNNGRLFYKNKEIKLGPHAFYIDAQLTDEEVKQYQYVYNSINEASRHLNNGTETNPMVLYIAPYVYWIDDPDDPAVRVAKTERSTPFGLEIRCNWLKFFGLSDHAADVVLACNRGQTIGAKGNFTMLNIDGDGAAAENITFGNYCNVNLEYPLKPALGRKKRASAIVQAQLVFCNGDKILVRNTRFISRLNLCPFIGGKRTLFDRCHFESTDDALNGRAVYLNCTFDFYSGKPFWGTSGAGAVFLNCDIRSFTNGEQYFVKSGGQVAVVDTRFSSTSLTYIGWKDKTPPETRNYAYNVSLNGKPVVIDSRNAMTTVNMKDKQILNAYRLVYNGTVLYNTYNLLKGEDDWDPMGIKNKVLAAEKANGQQYTNMPIQLLVVPPRENIETGKDHLVLKTVAREWGSDKAAVSNLKWTMEQEADPTASLLPSEGETCIVKPLNNSNEVKKVYVVATAPSGLEAVGVVHISPPILPAPGFKVGPSIYKSSNGTLNVDYVLNANFKDRSEITWYRCTDQGGTNPVEVAVTRFGEPKLTYQLTAADKGYFIMAEVKPAHIRSYLGAAQSAITSEKINGGDIQLPAGFLNVDMKNMSVKNQYQLIPGFFTWDSFAPDDTREFNWKADTTKNAWYYGIGTDGAAADTGWVQAVQGARLRYTPVGNKFSNMKVSFTAVPAKTAGQGFGSARAQYLDVFIKFDTQTLTGYALRIIRTVKYGNAVDFVLMKYENGVASPVSDPVSATCFRPDCDITLEVSGSVFKVHAENQKKHLSEPADAGLVKVVDLQTNIEGNDFGGFGFQHTGTVGAGATLIKNLKIKWE